MTEILQSIYYLVEFGLKRNSPVLSGNMKSGIEVVSVSEHQIELCINAPFYDLKEWRKTGAIIYTGADWKGTGITDYAFWVNEIGAFGTHNKSETWVNKVLLDAAKTTAVQYSIPLENVIMRLRTKYGVLPENITTN